MNMQASYDRRIKILVHGLAWILTFLALLATLRNVDGFDASEQSLAIPILTGLIYSISVFYLDCRFLSQRLARPLKLLGSLLLMFVIVLIFSVLESFTDQFLYERLSLSGKDRNFYYFFYPNLIINLLVTVLAFAYQATENWIGSEKQKNALIEEQLRSEMAFLQASVNPHFLFNSLNLIYADALKTKNKDLTDNINLLAELMRYMVYEVNKTAVPLSTELKYMKDYVSIWHKRLDKNLVTIKIEDELENKDIMISPLLLIPLVENAFKHGHTPGKVSHIRIETIQKKESLCFKVNNPALAKEKQPETSGFGLSNLRQRLNVRYPDRHTLRTNLKNEVFAAELKIDLTHD